MQLRLLRSFASSREFVSPVGIVNVPPAGVQTFGMDKLESGGHTVIVIADNVAFMYGAIGPHGLNNGKVPSFITTTGVFFIDRAAPAENSPNILLFSLSQFLPIHIQG